MGNGMCGDESIEYGIQYITGLVRTHLEQKVGKKLFFLPCVHLSTLTWTSMEPRESPSTFAIRDLGLESLGPPALDFLLENGI
ncbi:Kinesin-Like Protein Kif26A [Manis pentadactyla]|nr:Kinesin-Like Protein Kif26A [Manis pentadactyla]